MRWVAVVGMCAIAGLAGAPAAGAERGWLPADKEGFATAIDRSSPVWLTLRQGIASEVFWPDLDTPSVRSLELTVGRERESAGKTTTSLPDVRALIFRQVVDDQDGDWRLTKTWVTDPARPVVLLDVRYESLDGRARPLGVRLDPSLGNGPHGDRGGRIGRTLVARDGRFASALRSAPGLRRPAVDTAGRGDVEQAASTRVTGVRGRRHATFALAFGPTPRVAARRAERSLRAGFRAVAARYRAGWHRYVEGLKDPPAAAAQVRSAYLASLLVLRASEDKRFPGASIASPSMPWAWGDGRTERPSGPYHLVWSRDLYHVATALLAAGDRGSAERMLTYLFERQQRPDGSFPQNSRVDGTPHWRKLQMDQVAFPLILAWQLGRDDARTYRRHVRPAANVIARRGPRSQQERWENQSGFSPATIAAEVAGLVCAAELARRVGDTESAARWEAAADRFEAGVEDWTLSRDGPLSDEPYYLRVTKDGRPDVGTTYGIGDSGPSELDQREVVDPSFLELVRLGLRRPDDPNVRSTLEVVDRTLSVRTPKGVFWHRFTHDGYGETPTGEPWFIGTPDTHRTFGRLWPLLTGERGEVEVMAGRDAREHLAAIAATANGGLMLPEQVWDQSPPVDGTRHEAGTGTFAATPLAWTHAQLVRLAWAIEGGWPPETPAIVSCRYTGARC